MSFDGFNHPTLSYRYWTHPHKLQVSSQQPHKLFHIEANQQSHSFDSETIWASYLTLDYLLWNNGNIPHPPSIRPSPIVQSNGIHRPIMLGIILVADQETYEEKLLKTWKYPQIHISKTPSQPSSLLWLLGKSPTTVEPKGTSARTRSKKSKRITSPWIGRWQFIGYAGHSLDTLSITKSMTSSPDINGDFPTLESSPCSAIYVGNLWKTSFLSVNVNLNIYILVEVHCMSKLSYPQPNDCGIAADIQQIWVLVFIIQDKATILDAIYWWNLGHFGFFYTSTLMKRQVLYGEANKGLIYTFIMCHLRNIIRNALHGKTIRDWPTHGNIK